MINECLTSYVEFKRTSVQLIFEQFRGAENFDAAILGDQDENLETQSSLDNIGEQRSGRLSHSIISSTQRSDRDTTEKISEKNLEKLASHSPIKFETESPDFDTILKSQSHEVD